MNCAKSLYIYDRRMYIDRDLWNLYILRRSLRLFESSFSAYFTFSALSHLEILRPHTVADLNINLLAASLSNKVDFPLIELADINIISTAKKLDANDVFIYSAIIPNAKHWMSLLQNMLHCIEKKTGRCLHMKEMSLLSTTIFFRSLVIRNFQRAIPDSSKDIIRVFWRDALLSIH